MTSNGTRPRGAITIEQRIRSRRSKDGQLSIFARLDERAIANCADSIAHANPYAHLTEDDITRSVQLWSAHHPGSARSTEEQAANLRARRQIEGRKTPVRDINRQLLQQLSPAERLNLANTGCLPDRFIVLGPEDAE